MKQTNKKKYLSYHKKKKSALITIFPRARRQRLHFIAPHKKRKNTVIY